MVLFEETDVLCIADREFFKNSRIIPRSSIFFLFFSDGNWQVPHSLALFEETDVLCVADREGGRVECINAGLQKPLHANRDDTGKRVVNYNQKVIGRPYAIASKGKLPKTKNIAV